MKFIIKMYKTLRDINPMPGNERAPAFAHNAILLDGDGGEIRVGDLVKLKGKKS